MQPAESLLVGECENGGQACWGTSAEKAMREGGTGGSDSFPAGCIDWTGQVGKAKLCVLLYRFLLVV